MTDERDIAEDDADNAEEAGPVGGERLGAARREQQIPLLEIAKELHLDEYKVRALERNEFDVLGAPVFAKGHLRKYAQLVGVGEDDVMADYYQLNRSEKAPPIVLKRRRESRELSPGPWIVGIVLLLAVAAAYWWFVERVPAARDVLPADSAPVSQTVSPQDETPTIPLPQGDAADDADTANDDAVSEPAVNDVAATPVAAIEPPDSNLQLAITYSGECWTEITDASGRRLFFDLGRTGRTVNLRGEPPLNVLFGDADNVSLRVNGSDYPIPPAFRRGKTARLTITGS